MFLSVAKTPDQKEVLVDKGSRLSFSTFVEKPREDAKQVSSASNRMVYLSEIPSGITKVMLMNLLENYSGGDIESINYSPKHNTAAATFTDSVG